MEAGRMGQPAAGTGAAPGGHERPPEFAKLVPDVTKLVSDLESARVTTGIVRSLADVVELAGGNREQFLRATGLSPERLHKPDDRLTFPEFNRIRTLALDITGDDGLGLRWAASMTDRSLVPISHLVAHSASLRQALELLARYVHVLSDRLAYDIFPRDQRVVLRYLPLAGEGPRIARCTVEMLIGGFWSLFECFGGKQWLGPVRFGYPAPDYHAAYRRYFGRDVLFDQAHSELEFDIALLDVPSPQRDDEVRDAIRELVEQRMMRIFHTRPWSRRVREQLMREAVAGRPDMESAARTLGVSARTLRRRLSDEGTRFEDVATDARCAKAKQLLRDPARPIQEVAYALGFSDSSTFHRAFKRWTGTTPKGFRDAQLEGDS